MNNTIKHFTFLPNLKPLATLDNEAKKLHKSGKIKGLSKARNHLTKELFNKPYNKLVNGLKKASPMLKNGILYIPVLIDSDRNEHLEKNESFYYYLVMNSDSAAAGFGLSFDFSDYVDNFNINNIKISDIHKKENGWFIQLNDEYGIEVNCADECIFLELLFDDKESFESVESTYIQYSETFSPYDEYITIKDKDITDLEAAYYLESDDLDFEAKLYSIGGIECAFYGSWFIQTNDEVLSPSQVISELKIENKVNEFWDWMIYNKNHVFKDYSIVNETTPYFGYSTEEGDYIDDIFDTLPKTLTEKSFSLAEYFLS